MEITKEGIYKYIEDYGAIEALRSFAELIDKRVYFKISNNGIERKELNIAFPAVAFLKDLDSQLVCSALHESINPVERQHIVKINRLSNLSVDKLKEKFLKLIIKESKEHAFSYGKELLLKDEEEFYKTLSEIILMDSLKNMKSLMLLSFKKLGRKDDEFIFLLISYIIKVRADYSLFEKKQEELKDENERDCKLELLNYIEKFKSKILYSDSKKGIKVLEIAAYLKLLSETMDESNQNRYKVFLEIVKYEMENKLLEITGKEKQLTEIEEKILSVIF